MDNDNRFSEQKVEFENPGERPSGYYDQQKASRIVELTMKYSGGIIKDERQASYVILTVSIFITIASLFFLFNGEDVPNIPPPANYPPLQNK